MLVSVSHFPVIENSKRYLRKPNIKMTADFDWADTLINNEGDDGEFNFQTHDYSRDMGGNKVGGQTVANNSDNFIG